MDDLDAGLSLSPMSVSVRRGLISSAATCLETGVKGAIGGEEASRWVDNLGSSWNSGDPCCVLKRLLV